MITDLRIDENRKRLYYEKGYWQSQTLNDIWNGQSRTFADRIYVKDDGDNTLTYAEVDEQASRVASWLANCGVENGDIVTLQVPKWVEFAVAGIACVKIGAVVHSLDARLSGDALFELLERVRPAAFIAPTLFKDMRFDERSPLLRERIDSLKAIGLIDRDFKQSFEGADLLSDILGTFEPYRGGCPSRSDDVACILATSGSTGTPKMVMHTHNNILFSERVYLSVLDLDQDDRMWMPSPLNHATGLYHGLVAATLLGSSVALQQDYTPASALDFIRENVCTWSHGATPFIFDVLKLLEETNSPNLPMKLYLCGGAPVPQTLIERAHRHGVLLCESYGSTESCPHIIVPPKKCLEWNGHWSGIPYEGIEVRVVDQYHRPVAPGVQGEEASRGPHQFVGYLNEPERTDAALDADGWFYSGDLCVADEQGRIRITGRIKDIIIRGGENISTNEVDANLIGCPGIGAHATIGMPDERLGDRICTFVVPQGAGPTLDDVKAFLRSKKVAKRVWPERIEFIDAIPYTPTGKVKKWVLTEELKRRMGEKENEK
ncbi:AMP-binding protein [Curtanaerobium respiraculi]|uniref:AMP-binding protein n=1 Tax=Curtanaerobium respiraculi TaxID=2949669 RepID=UPI0024B3246A|nr:AMP-binding protein [Curtanaerobium respiraculi]